MKPRTMLLLVVAVICGLGASYMTTWLIASRTPTVETVEIWVAKPPDGIKANTKIEKPDEMFERRRILKEDFKKMPKALVVKDSKDSFLAISDPDGEKPRTLDLAKDEQGKPRYINKALSQGQFITEKDFQVRGEGLEPPPGFTAAAIKADAQTTAGGFVLPNSRVDILWLEEPKANGQRKCSVKLQNVLVLAVDQLKDRATDKSANANVASPSTITLAVTDQQAKDLGYWQERGRLRLALRAPGDQIIIKDPGVESPDDPDAPQATKQAKAPTVEVWVAAEDLRAGTRLMPKHLRQRRFLKEEAPKNALALDKLESRTIRQPVRADQIISALDFQGQEEGPKSDGAAPKSEQEPEVKPEKTRTLYIIEGSSLKPTEVKVKDRPAARAEK